MNLTNKKVDGKDEGTVHLETIDEGDAGVSARGVGEDEDAGLTVEEKKLVKRAT